MTPRSRRWTLGSESFDRLLLLFDADRERAGEKYEAVHARLVRIFEWRGCTSPESLADEAMDRVSRRLEQGERIRAADPVAYFYGVARNVLKEYWTDQRKETAIRMSGALLREQTVLAPEQAERELRLECLDRCLAKLPGASRRLIERYYRSSASEKIAERAALAQSLGVTPGTLRIRAHRIRRLLEACVNESMRRALGHEIRP